MAFTDDNGTNKTSFDIYPIATVATVATWPKSYCIPQFLAGRDTTLSYQLAFFLRKHGFPAKRKMLGPYALKAGKMRDGDGDISAIYLLPPQCVK